MCWREQEKLLHNQTINVLIHAQSEGHTDKKFQEHQRFLRPLAC